MQVAEAFIPPSIVILAIVGSYFAALSPGFLQDLQRFAPHLHGEIDKLKERNIPTVFGRILAFGREQGMVRDDIDVAFLIEFWLQTIKGVHEPASLARTGLTPKAAFDKALDLFLRGILTPKGRAQIAREHGTSGARRGDD